VLQYFEGEIILCVQEKSRLLGHFKPQGCFLWRTRYTVHSSSCLPGYKMKIKLFFQSICTIPHLTHLLFLRSIQETRMKG
jgi:hypothetical protein